MGIHPQRGDWMVWVGVGCGMLPEGIHTQGKSGSKGLPGASGKNY